MTHDHASAPPSADALHDDLGPETLARVLAGLRAMPTQDAGPEGGGEAGADPDVPLPRRR